MSQYKHTNDTISINTDVEELDLDAEEMHLFFEDKKDEMEENERVLDRIMKEREETELQAILDQYEYNTDDQKKLDELTK